MHALFVQFSGLVGLLVFLNGLWGHAPLERTIFSSFASGMAIYLALLVGEAVVRRILAYSPPQLAEEATGGDGGTGTPEPAADR